VGELIKAMMEKDLFQHARTSQTKPELL